MKMSSLIGMICVVISAIPCAFLIPYIGYIGAATILFFCAGILWLAVESLMGNICKSN